MSRRPFYRAEEAQVVVDRLTELGWLVLYKLKADTPWIQVDPYEFWGVTRPEHIVVPELAQNMKLLDPFPRNQDGGPHLGFGVPFLMDGYAEEVRTEVSTREGAMRPLHIYLQPGCDHPLPFDGTVGVHPDEMFWGWGVYQLFSGYEKRLPMLLIVDPRTSRPGLAAALWKETSRWILARRSLKFPYSNSYQEFFLKQAPKLANLSRINNFHRAMAATDCFLEDLRPSAYQSSTWLTGTSYHARPMDVPHPEQPDFDLERQRVLIAEPKKTPTT